MSNYYVAVDGLDTNPGSMSQPFKTITKASSVVLPGDNVFIFEGTYPEIVNLSRSGATDNPISYNAINEGIVIVDGKTLSLGTYSPLFRVSGSNIHVSDIEVCNSKGMGVIVSGTKNVLTGINSHHNFTNGILVTGNDNIVEYCTVFRCCLHNENGISSSWASGLTAARSPSNVILRDNFVMENWGEGLSCYEARNISILNNVVRDNFSANIYVSDTDTARVDGNIVFMSPTSYVFGHGSNVGIMLGDETYNPPSAHITVTNNISYGNRRNFYWWRGVQGGAMNDVLVANNTFVDAVDVTGAQINDSTHVNARFLNNIVSQNGNFPVTMISKNVVMDHNLLNKAPTTWNFGTNTIVADPKFVAPSVFNFSLQDGSRAIGAGLILVEVPKDFYSVVRGGRNDLGAIQYDTVVITTSSSVSSSVSKSPSPSVSNSASSSVSYSPSNSNSSSVSFSPSSSVSPSVVPVSTYFLSPVFGDDEFEGTLYRPFRTMEKALRVALPTDIIYLIIEMK